MLGFCFDSLCRDVIMDDERLEDYNFDIKVFTNYISNNFINLLRA